MTPRAGLYPTARAVLLTAAGAPVALLVGVALPSAWALAFGWLVLLAALLAADALLATPAAAVHATLAAPITMPVGGAGAITATVHASTLRAVELTVDLDDRLARSGEARQSAVLADTRSALVWPVTAARRGTARIGALWLRWRGPLGLVWRQRRKPIQDEVLILPDLRPVSEEAPLLLRRAAAGERAREARGLGTEFHALIAFAEGMDRRWIDWKQSARHGELLARDWRMEQNHQIVMAVDAGRAMVEPAEGVPRLDRAITAALIAAYVALKLGDRVGLFAYAGRPLTFSGILARAGAFAALQRHAAGIDYAATETNHVLGLTRLAQRLDRRTLIVVFTEFADPTAAEHLLRVTTTLLSRHLLLFVVGNDPELDQAIASEPLTTEDVTRAVAGAALARERALVLARLRRLGAHVVETAPGAAGSTLVEAYLSLKRQGWT